MNSLTAVSDVTQRGAHILARSGRSDGKQRFRSAVRHSRHVRILRIAVPLSVVVVVVGGIALTVLKPLRVLSGVPVDVGSLVVSGTKIMMQQPRLAGFTRDNRRYNLIAQAAAQDVTKPDMIELHGVTLGVRRLRRAPGGSMEMKDGAVFETTARDGLYNSKTELLTLSQNIVVTSSSGYKALLNEAVIEVRAGRVVSDKPVEVKTATWTINANGMEVAESGDVMRFDRGVFVTMMLEGGAKPVVTSDGRKP